VENFYQLDNLFKHNKKFCLQFNFFYFISRNKSNKSRPQLIALTLQGEFVLQSELVLFDITNLFSDLLLHLIASRPNLTKQKVAK